jgi:ankyrin repeat protein
MKYDGILLHQDRLGQTPLFSAVRANQYELIKQLSIPLDMINLPDKLAGHSLLFYSAACRNDDLCCLLVRKGANVLAKDLCGQSILSYTSKTPKFAQLAKNLIKKAAK